MLVRAFALSVLALAAVPGCLLVQPLPDVNEGESGDAGERGDPGGSGGRGGGSSGNSGKGDSGAAGSAGVAGNAGRGSGGDTSTSGSGSGAESGENGQGGNSGSSTAGTGSGGMAGGSGGSGTVNYTRVWTFDADDEGFELSTSSSTDLRNDTLLEHDYESGDPDDGSLKLTIPFSEAGQDLAIEWDPPVPIDLTGHTLFARVRVVSGLGSESNPGSAQIFAQSGTDYTWGDQGATSIAASDGWKTISFDFDQNVVDQGFDPASVVRIGLQFFSNGSSADLAEPTVIHVDSIGLDDTVRPACVKNPLLIDDMETPDGDAWICQTNGRGGAWFAYHDDSDGVIVPDTDQALTLEAVDTPRGDNTQVVHISGGGFTEWGGAVGTQLLPGSKTTSVYYDLSAYAGIEFWARGSGRMQPHIQTPKTRWAARDYPGTCLPTFNIKCDDNFVAEPIELTNDWVQYTVPFSAFFQQNYGMPVAFDYQIYSIEFHFLANENFDFWIDDLSLLERECELDGPRDCGSGTASSCKFGTIADTSCSEYCASYGDVTCAAGGCECHSATDPDCLAGVQSFCACIADTYQCTPDAEVKLYQGCVYDSSYWRRNAMLCYGTNADDCATSASTCWPAE